MSPNVRGLAAALAAALSLACSSSGSGPPITPVALEPLVSMDDSGFEARERSVIRTEDAWASAWQRIWGRHGEVPPLPEVDFERDRVVLAAMGTRPTSGHSIGITDANVEDGTLRVRVVEVSPGQGCVTAQVITHPVAAARVARVDGEVVFDEASEVHRCE